LVIILSINFKTFSNSTNEHFVVCVTCLQYHLTDPTNNTKQGTIENHGNMEITETVIFIKCCDFAKMLRF